MLLWVVLNYIKTLKSIEIHYNHHFYLPVSDTVSDTGNIHNKYLMNKNKPKQNELGWKSVGRTVTKPNTNNILSTVWDYPTK